MDMHRKTNLFRMAQRSRCNLPSETPSRWNRSGIWPADPNETAPEWEWDCALQQFWVKSQKLPKQIIRETEFWSVRSMIKIRHTYCSLSFVPRSTELGGARVQKQRGRWKNGAPLHEFRHSKIQAHSGWDTEWCLWNCSWRGTQQFLHTSVNNLF